MATINTLSAGDSYLYSTGGVFNTILVGPTTITFFTEVSTNPPRAGQLFEIPCDGGADGLSFSLDITYTFINTNSLIINAKLTFGNRLPLVTPVGSVVYQHQSEHSYFPPPFTALPIAFTVKAALASGDTLLCTYGVLTKLFK
jgi:hypothetical protein